MARAKKTNEPVVADNPDVLEAGAPQSVFPATAPHPGDAVDQSKDRP